MAQLNVTAKPTISLRIVMFVLGLLGRLRLLNLESALETVRFISRKGWAFKYRIGNNRWSKLELDFEVEEGK